MTATLTRYTIRARSFGVGVWAGVNGSPTLVDQKGEGRAVFRDVNEWIMPQENKLSGVIVQPPGAPSPNGKPAGGNGAYVNMEVYMADADGEPAGGAPPLAKFSWPLPGAPQVFPFPFSVPFVIPRAIETRVWKAAEVVKRLEAADRQEILNLVNQLIDALSQGSKAGVVDLTKFRLDDEAIAQGYSSEDVRQAAANMVQAFSVVKQPPAPLTSQEAQISPVAGGRLFYVTRGSFGPAVLFEDDERRLSVNVYVAKVDGRWTIVR